MDTRKAGDHPVVILNMHYSGLAIARDISGLARRIVGLSSTTRFLGNRSRFIEFRQYPDTETEPESCKDFLIELAAREPPLLLPTRDHDVRLMMKHRSEFDDAFIVPYPDTAIVASINDKTSLASSAKNSGIDCPTSIEISERSEIHARRSDFIFPAVAKPVEAADWRKAGIRDIVNNSKAVRIDSLQELDSFYSRVSNYAERLLVQEYIAGPDSNLVVFGSYRSSSSGSTTWFTARKLLQYPAGAGTGVAVQACKISEIVKPSLELLDQFGYSGISEIEYKFDSVRRKFALIEINTRHWDQHGLGTSVGVNLTEAMYCDLCLNESLARTQSDRNVCWVADDKVLPSILDNFKTHHYEWSVYRQIAFGKKIMAIASLKDPLPILSVVSGTILDFIRKIFRKLFQMTLRRRPTSSRD